MALLAVKMSTLEGVPFSPSLCLRWMELVGFWSWKMAGEYLEKQKCKTNQRNQNLPTASHLAVELDGIVGNITYSLKLKKRNVLWGPFSCFSCCQAILTEIELLLINPKDTIGCSCLKQGLSLTFGRSQWEERNATQRKREQTNWGAISRPRGQMFPETLHLGVVSVLLRSPVYQI